MKLKLVSIIMVVFAVLTSCNKDDNNDYDNNNNSNTTISTTSSFQFTPATMNAKVGDVITFKVGPGHTATRVGEATWNANADDPVTGFNFSEGTHTYTIEASDVGTIYYVCLFHVGTMGMKGKIVVTSN